MLSESWVPPSVSLLQVETQAFTLVLLFLEDLDLSRIEPGTDPDSQKDKEEVPPAKRIPNTQRKKWLALGPDRTMLVLRVHFDMRNTSTEFSTTGTSNKNTNCVTARPAHPLCQQVAKGEH